MLAGLKMTELYTEIWQQVPVKPLLLHRKKEASSVISCTVLRIKQLILRRALRPKAKEGTKCLTET